MYFTASACGRARHISWSRDSRREDYRGRNAIEVWIGTLQAQPELASGISTSPPAGTMLIQQPGRELRDKGLVLPSFALAIITPPLRQKR